MRFIREKRCACKNGYMEIDIYQISNSNSHKLPRAKREKISLPKQKKLNDENSRRVARLLINENFDTRDYFITLTYGKEYLPDNAKAAFQRFIRKLRRLYKQKGVELRYFYVTEEGARNKRMHHHIIVNGSGVSRDEIEDLWECGFANADRLQRDSDGSFNSLSDYLMKNAENAEKHTRRWNCSRNLRRPVERTSDNAVNRKQLRSLIEAKRNDSLTAAVERLYKGYKVVKAFVSVNEVTGLYYVKLRLMKKT